LGAILTQNREVNDEYERIAELAAQPASSTFAESG